MAWLDSSGLAHLWGKITSALAEKLDKTATSRKTASIPMGYVDDTSTATEFTATVDGISELRDGVCVWLRNGIVTSASGFTINVNGLGAKPVYSSLAAATRSTTIFNVAYTLLLIYNSERVEGGCWDVVYGIDTNTNTIGYQVRHNSSTLPAIVNGYRYRLWFTSADGEYYVPANQSTSTNATSLRDPTSIPIDPFGEIIYYGYNGLTKKNTNLTASNVWTQYTLSLGYSFNDTDTALALTPYKPVYIECTPQSDGSAVLHGYTQDKPTTDDGFIYIYLGLAYSTTNVELSQHHPVYWHDGVSLRLWTGTRVKADTTTYTITVSLTNPVNASEFSDCSISELLSADMNHGITYDTGILLGSIESPTGSTTVTLSGGKYGIEVVCDGMSIGSDNCEITCTGGVTCVLKNGGTFLYEVTGDGTITIDGLDYDD